MPILHELSSQRGERNGAGNARATELCLQNPDLLAELVAGLQEEDAALITDIFAVLYYVGDKQPVLVEPYAELAIPFVDHPNTWVKVHAAGVLELMTVATPAVSKKAFGVMHRHLFNEPSQIVRFYGGKFMRNYASLGEAEARQTYPVLLEIFDDPGNNGEVRALEGLIHVGKYCPDLLPEIIELAELHLRSPRPTIRTTAKKVLQAFAPEKYGAPRTR